MRGDKSLISPTVSCAYQHPGLGRQVRRNRRPSRRFPFSLPSLIHPTRISFHMGRSDENAQSFCVRVTPLQCRVFPAPFYRIKRCETGLVWTPPALDKWPPAVRPSLSKGLRGWLAAGDCRAGSGGIPQPLVFGSSGRRIIHGPWWVGGMRPPPLKCNGGRMRCGLRIDLRQETTVQEHTTHNSSLLEAHS